MEDIFWPALIMGPVMIVFGIVVIRFRKTLISVIIEAQSVLFGRRVGQIFADRTGSSALLSPGVGAVVLGVVIILMGVFLPREMF